MPQTRATLSHPAMPQTRATLSHPAMPRRGGPRGAAHTQHDPYCSAGRGLSCTRAGEHDGQGHALGATAASSHERVGAGGGAARTHPCCRPSCRAHQTPSGTCHPGTPAHSRRHPWTQPSKTHTQPKTKTQHCSHTQTATAARSVGGRDGNTRAKVKGGGRPPPPYATPATHQLAEVVIVLHWVRLGCTLEVPEIVAAATATATSAKRRPAGCRAVRGRWRRHVCEVNGAQATQGTTTAATAAAAACAAAKGERVEGGWRKRGTGTHAGQHSSRKRSAIVAGRKEVSSQRTQPSEGPRLKEAHSPPPHSPSHMGPVAPLTNTNAAPRRHHRRYERTHSSVPADRPGHTCLRQGPRMDEAHFPPPSPSHMGPVAPLTNTNAAPRRHHCRYERTHSSVPADRPGHTCLRQGRRVLAGPPRGPVRARVPRRRGRMRPRPGARGRGRA
jgi:hypothetical protein